MCVLRRLSDEVPHSAAATAATFTASSTSAADARVTSPVCTPRAGSKTGARRAEVPSTRRPLIQCPIVFMWCRLIEAVQLTGLVPVDSSP